jgi:hypothetical protein
MQAGAARCSRGAMTPVDLARGRDVSTPAGVNARGYNPCVRRERFAQR